jgi:O-antigen biosynthesis protein
MTVSVVIPVKDGARYLGEVLEALAREAPDEVMVIDSGSTDGSVEIARAAGATVIEIAPEDFGHGRTRNLGAERSRGELICFLTQDATPVAGWLDAYRSEFAADPRLGVAFGPHLPRSDSSPMIARELTDFFGRGFADDEPYLSDVNACYRRECWAEIRFRDVAYSEDQAFGRDVLDTGWRKTFVPEAGVLHAHDFGAVEFMRRYFDEYRGLRESAGHVEPFGVRSTARAVKREVVGDRRYMREHGFSPAATARWTARSALHHGGRRVFSALGSRAERLPAGLQRAISLEGQGAKPAPEHRALSTEHSYGPWAIARYHLDGPAPLLDPPPADREQLHIAVLIPPFRIGSGGHNTIFQVTSRLERMGHTCSIWIDDPVGMQENEWPAYIRGAIREHFAPLEGPVFKGFSDWYGADVVMATGWQTVHPAMLLEGARSRVYFVNDHEPEFYATSIERTWCEDTYRMGLHCIAASPWLRDLLTDRYGASASAFQLGVDHSTYAPQPLEREADTVIFYARSVTARRAVGLGVIALEELKRRRPQTRIVLYGDHKPVPAPFEYEDLGIATPAQLARAYSQTSVGLCLSMTNFSLIPKEMMACGLPCVELAGVSAESIFGPGGGPLELAEADPIALADAIERLLDDRELWERHSREGIDAVASHTWDVAAEQTEAGIRHALREREESWAAAGSQP